MSFVTWVRSMLAPQPKKIAAGTTPATKLPNLPVHPNYSGNGMTRQ